MFFPWALAVVFGVLSRQIHLLIIRSRKPKGGKKRYGPKAGGNPANPRACRDMVEKGKCERAKCRFSYNKGVVQKAKAAYEATRKKDDAGGNAE